MKKSLAALAAVLLAFGCQTKHTAVAAASEGSPADGPQAEPVLPVRGFCIGVPRPKDVDRFIDFLNDQLTPLGVNTLILRVDYNYQYQSHPELVERGALSRSDVKKIVAACRDDNIRIIPSIDLIGHQGWEEHENILLQKYPQFDETPWVKNPEHYKWPNADGLYCRSYCTLNPDVHKVLFAVIDELCDAFEADAFHGGMDEVFYLGESKCPYCGGKNKAELFAGEVKRIHDHLQEKGRALWIWGDRLLDGRVTGLGQWEASFNDTAPAIDLIPKDVVICDWHYDRPDFTAAYFAAKGFKVLECPWQKPWVGVADADDLIEWRHTQTPEIRERLLGVVQTVWSSESGFLDMKGHGGATGSNTWECLTKTFHEIDKRSGVRRESSREN